MSGFRVGIAQTHCPGSPFVYPYWLCSLFFHQSSSLVCKQTAATLCDVGITSNCLKILKTLLEHWRDVANQEEVSFAFIILSGCNGILMSLLYSLLANPSQGLLMLFIK